MVTSNDIVVSVLLLSVAGPGALLGTLTGLAYWCKRGALNRSFCFLMISSTIYDNLFFAATIGWAVPMTLLQIPTENGANYHHPLGKSGAENDPPSPQLAPAEQVTNMPPVFNNLTPNSNFEPEFRITSGFWAHRMGQLALTGWYGSCFHLLIVSLNRFCAVVTPFRYKQIFNPRNTAVMLVLLNIFTIAYTSFLFLERFDCGFLYYMSQYTWKYSNSKCSRIWYKYLGRTASALLPAFTLTLILATAGVMIKKRRHMTPTTGRTSSGGGRRRELYLFLVSALNVAMYLLTQGLWFISGYFFDLTPWRKFWSRHIIWVLCHASNGVVSVIVVRPIRQCLAAWLRCRSPGVPRVTGDSLRGASTPDNARTSTTLLLKKTRSTLNMRPSPRHHTRSISARSWSIV